MPRLRRKRAKAQLFAQRTVAERRSVAETAKAWNEIAEHTDRVAEQVLSGPAEQTPDLRAEIRRLLDRAEHHWRRR